MRLHFLCLFPILPAIARELSTDRPDKTESTHTVPAGRVQVEAELGSFTLDCHSTDASLKRFTAWSAGALNLKYGITDRWDVQFVLPAWSEQMSRFRDGRRERERGWSDLTVRAKWNLWGNDAGSTSGALMPFLTLPTAGGPFGAEGVEGGLIFPLALDLSESTGIGFMLEGDVRRGGNGDTQLAGIVSLTLGHDFTDQFGGYIEWFHEWSDATWVSTLDVGLTYAITTDVQLDVGANYGLTRSADDLSIFTGLSFRF